MQSEPQNIPQQDPFSALLNISEEINSLHNSQEILDRVLDIAMETIRAERGFILLKSANDQEGFRSVSARNISQQSITSIQEMSSSVANAVLEQVTPVLAFDAQHDDRFSDSKSIILQRIRSIACVPLMDQELLIGALYVDSISEADLFNDQSLKFLHAVARQAAIAIGNANIVSRLELENARLRKKISLSHLFPEITGESEQIRQILETITKVAESTATVLIEGESGTGKELVARALHHHSKQIPEKFVTVFCSGLTESLLESELFGHRRGAFTGAIEDRAGLFEEADGGTIFLDEIGDINLNTQTKLLRVIQEGEIKRVGESKIRKVNVRILSATNKDLWKEVQNKNFREDLYYRLNVISMRLPSLRERGDDIKLLAEHFLKLYARENGKKIDGFTAAALNTLYKYRWPGNVRELQNAVERAVILASGKSISPDLFNLTRTRTSDLIGRTLKEVEKAVILETLEMTGNHRTRASELLGVSRRWLQYRIKEWGIDRE